MTNRRIPTAALVLLVPVLAAIAAMGTRAVKGASTTAAASTRVPSVTIKNFAFRPAKLTVVKGTKLQVTNADAAAHTFSARNNSFSSPVLDPGRSATITLGKSGTFAFYCKIHANMTGTVVVK